jgi:hypothetical protein
LFVATRLTSPIAPLRTSCAGKIARCATSQSTPVIKIHTTTPKSIQSNTAAPKPTTRPTTKTKCKSIFGERACGQPRGEGTPYPNNPHTPRASSAVCFLVPPPSAPPNVRGTSAVPLPHSRTLHARHPYPLCGARCPIHPVRGSFLAFFALCGFNTATRHTRYAQHATGLSRRLLKKANRRASPSAQDPLRPNRCRTYGATSRRFKFPLIVTHPLRRNRLTQDFVLARFHPAPLLRVAVRPYQTPFINPPARDVRPNAPHNSCSRAEMRWQVLAT